jgi:hypothetical protein
MMILAKSPTAAPVMRRASSTMKTSSRTATVRVPSMLATSRRAAVVVRAEGDGPEIPQALKDMMKPPDASVAAPAWLAPLIGLAEQSGESATIVGYSLMVATSLFISIVLAILHFPGALVTLVFFAASAYTCWQATPYLAKIVDDVESAWGGDDSSDE